MSKKCKAFSASKLGLEPADNRKAFYAGWDAAIEQAEKHDPTGKNYLPVEPVGWMHNQIEGVVITHRPADVDRHPERWEKIYKECKA